MKKTELLQNIWKAYPHTLGYHLSDHKWYPYRWLKYVSKLAVSAILEGNKRIIINAPPRHGKSELLSHWLPVWYFENFPDKNIILTSYGQELASKFGRQIRNEFERHKNSLSTSLSSDSTAAHRFNTTQGGQLLCSGVGGPLTGFGGHLILVDDTVKNWDDGQNPTKLLQDAEWFTNTLRSRLEPDGTIIVLMTRWHVDDLTGILLQEYGQKWDHISLPAVAFKEDSLNRQCGEALCPERFDIEALRQWQEEMPDAVWQSNYLQTPREDMVLRAFKDWTSDLIKEIAWDYTLPLDISWDFNISPGMHVVIGQHNDNMAWELAEIYEDRLDLPSAVAKVVKFCNDKKNTYLNIYGDSTGNSQNVQTSQSDYDLIASILKQNNLPFTICVPKAQPPIRSSLLVCNHLFRKKTYFVSPACKGLIRDFRLTKLNDKGVISKETYDPHFGDAIRYKLSYLYGSDIMPVNHRIAKIGGVKTYAQPYSRFGVR
jgi:hypothetical protein